MPAHIDPRTVDAEHHPRIHQVAEASAQLAPTDFFEFGLDQLIASLTSSRRRQQRRTKA